MTTSQKPSIKENLLRISKIFSPDSIISDEDIQRAFNGLIGILAHYKENTESMNAETKELVKNFDSLVEKRARALVDELSSTHTSSKSDYAKTHGEALKELQKLLKEVKEISVRIPEDGKDADEEKIIAEVLSQIKIPDFKETILDTPIQLRDKLETLEGDDRLDISAIKGFDIFSTKEEIEEIKQAMGRIPLTGNGGIEVFKNGQKVGSGSALNFTGSGVTVTNRDGHITTINISGTGGSGGQVDSVVGGNGINVDNTDPVNPSISVDETELTTLAPKANPTFTGTMTVADVQLVENKTVLLDAALSADGKWSGIGETGTLGETVAFGEFVYFKAADSQWYKTDADATATAGSVKIGCCVVAGNDNDPTTILLMGKVRADSLFPSFTVGAPIFLSTTAGAVTNTAPSGTDDVVRIVGYGNTADEMYVHISNDYITCT